MPFTPDAPSRCEALLAEDEATAEGVGFALFFPNYSTFLTRRGFYLENLYVVPAARGRGAGLAWLQQVGPPPNAAANGSTGACSPGTIPPWPPTASWTLGRWTAGGGDAT